MPIAVKAKRIMFDSIDVYRRREVVAAGNNHREGRENDGEQVEEHRPGVRAARPLRLLLGARAPEPEAC